MTNKTIDVTGLTPEQIKQIQEAIETFRNINNSQSKLTEEQQIEFDPTPLFFESEKFSLEEISPKFNKQKAREAIAGLREIGKNLSPIDGVAIARESREELEQRFIF